VKQNYYWIFLWGVNNSFSKFCRFKTLSIVNERIWKIFYTHCLASVCDAWRDTMIPQQGSVFLAGRRRLVRVRNNNNEPWLNHKFIRVIRKMKIVGLRKALKPCRITIDRKVRTSFTNCTFLNRYSNPVEKARTLYTFWLSILRNSPPGFEAKFCIFTLGTVGHFLKNMTVMSVLHC